MVTIREIAKMAGVSPATVSRFFSGAEGVSDDKSSRIRNALSKAEDEKPPRVRINSNSLVGVLVPDLRLQFYADALREFMEQIVDYDFQLVFIPETENGKRGYLDTIKSSGLSGLILLNEEIAPKLMRFITDKSLRTVVCGGANLTGGDWVNAVHVNDLGGGYEGTRYLVSLGHRDIAFLGDLPKSISSGFQRMVGAKQALNEAGLPFHDELWLCGEMTDETGYKLTMKLLDTAVPFTALFAFSDQMAVGAMRALCDRGLCVGRDVSVMGFDDLPIAEAARPRLTTVRQPLKSIISNTLSIFNRPEQAMRGVEIHVPFCIVPRESCSRLSDGSKEALE